ncbi:MAG: hypothetical protein JSV17_07920 [Candidatus Aminicenantes bacterium]|nr:MAG: hypothetical protein JSV17_07920 [Candidatus Aminicenantes bacterium]
MKTQTIKIFSLCLLMALVVFACGGGEETSRITESADKPVEQKAEQKEKISPAEIGQQASELYVKTMGELVDLLKDKPEASLALPNVEVLKEACVVKMVEFGKKRESLDEAGRSAVDSQIRMKMNSFYNDPVFASFNELQQHYFQNRAFHKIVMSFNVITQYANFDLLKKQEPEEALRLGIQ